MIRLERSFHPKIWGAASLEPWFAGDGGKIGEVWFTRTPPLPILVKFIFTTGRLSVQVHPDKTEMWHVLRAGPGAAIAAGFRQPITRERARDASLSGEIEHLVEWIPVAPGDTLFIPAGTVHAIGAGVAICEIQQNSDVTYRLYDYGRPRELHLERALAVAQFTRHPGLAKPRPEPDGGLLLAECPYFTTSLVELPPRERRLPVREQEILIVLGGAGEFDGQRFAAGDAWLVPDGTRAVPVRVESAARLLRTFQPR